MEVKPNDFVHTKYIIDYDQQKIYFFVLGDLFKHFMIMTGITTYFQQDFNVPVQ